MTDNNRLNKYITTFIVSVLVVFFLCLCVELELLFRCEKKVTTEELNLANLSKFCTISQLEKKLKNDPNNYLAEIKLAQIYESLEEYDKANELYLKALKLSGNSDYSLYSYSLFLAKRGLFALSAINCEKMGNHGKNIIKYRAKIYKTIADNLFSQKQYAGALRAYQIAFKYAKTMKDKKFFNSVKEKYVETFIKVADTNVEDGEIQEAISNLENALKLKEDIEAKYKLAIILQTADPKRAQKLIEETFNENPYVINPYIYNQILELLINEYSKNNQKDKRNYYIVKKRKFEKKLKEFYIYKDDIIISNFTIIKEKKLFNKNKYYISFDIKNNTKQKIYNLYFKFDLFVNKKEYSVEKKIISTKNTLNYYEKKEGILIELPNDIEFLPYEFKNDLTTKIYAKKRKNSPYTLIKIDTQIF